MAAVASILEVLGDVLRVCDFFAVVFDTSQGKHNERRLRRRLKWMANICVRP